MHIAYSSLPANQYHEIRPFSSENRNNRLNNVQIGMIMSENFDHFGPLLSSPYHILYGTESSPFECHFDKFGMTNGTFAKNKGQELNVVHIISKESFHF